MVLLLEVIAGVIVTGLLLMLAVVGLVLCLVAKNADLFDDPHW